MSGRDRRRHWYGSWGRVPSGERAAVVTLLRAMADDARASSDSDVQDVVALDLHAAADLLDLAGPARRRVEQRRHPRPRVTVRKLLEQHGGWLYSVDVAREIGMSNASASAQLRKLWRAGVLESKLSPSPASTLKRRCFRALAAQEAAE